LKAIARRFEITRTLILFWLDKDRRGALTEEDNLEEKVRDYEAKIAALERKVGQLTMELDVLKKLGPSSTSQPAVKASIVSGPLALVSVKDAKPRACREVAITGRLERGILRFARSFGLRLKLFASTGRHMATGVSCAVEAGASTISEFLG